MKNLYRLLCIVALFAGHNAFAQQITLKGTVQDENGEPIIGAAVIDMQNTTSGALTDIDGNYTINVDGNSSIEVSYLGFTTQQIPVNGRARIDITMREDSEFLEEVVVIGYGTVKKRDLTGAVSSVGNKSIQDMPVANVGQALQGKVAGVQIIDAGKPGDNVTIRVRGLGTINNSEPLIVIDGVPTDLGLSAINMNDVDRIDVLKDASATAIYGARGANGVVMVTTKQGRPGDGQLSVNASWALQKVAYLPPPAECSGICGIFQRHAVGSRRSDQSGMG